MPGQGVPGELPDQVMATIAANREHRLDTAACCGRLDQRTRRIE